MTDNSGASTTEAPPAKKKSGGLNSMLLADLKGMAGGMGITGAGSMKKAQLIDAIKAAQSGQGARPAQEQPVQRSQRQPAAARADADVPSRSKSDADVAAKAEPTTVPRTEAKAEPKTEPSTEPKSESKTEPKSGSTSEPRRRQRSESKGEARTGASASEAEPSDAGEARAERPSQAQRQRQNNQQGSQQGNQQGSQQPRKAAAQQAPQDRADLNDDDDNDDDGHDDDGEGGARRNRRRRGRDRNRTTREQEHEVREDDVLVPAAGILDVLDNYAFVRTSGYLAGVDDVYLSLSLVRKYALRRGDAVAGQVRQPREGERREKFNPMVRIDAVNGADPELAKNRPDFSTFVPTHPTERLRMETTPDNLTGRLLDLAAPIGKGQRGLITARTKSGRTTLLRSIASSVTANNPESHLMVVLLDERPEEVTDFQRAIKGEVVASTFDRPALDHVTAAELAVERAKRLVELGHDVVVLFDGLTRLGRAYNLAGAANGRVVTGAVEADALYGLKRLFGSARNVHNGGSLTIIATVVVDSASAIDQLLFEEIDGTENLEIRLRRDLAEERAFPAIDVVASGTRHADLLTSGEEQAILTKLDAELAELSPHDAHRSLAERLGRTRTNIEFLMGVQRG